MSNLVDQQRALLNDTSATKNLFLVLNWFPQTGMSGVVIAAPLTEGLPATPHTAIRANRRSAISTFSHSAIATGRQMEVGYANSLLRRDGVRRRRDGVWLLELDHPDLPIVSSSNSEAVLDIFQSDPALCFGVGELSVFRTRQPVRFPYKPDLSLIPFALVGG
jgi:hypothetical protein